MFLKRDHLQNEPVAAGEGSGAGTSASAADGGDSPVVGELIASLNQRRAYGEIALALRSGIRDVLAEFSFLRLQGLRGLLKAIRSVADNAAVAGGLFRRSQSVPELQVVPVIFSNSLRHPKDDIIANLDHIFGIEPMKVTSPATDSEVALALRVLEGCFLLHKESKILAKQHGAVKVLLNILSTRGALAQGACIDALMSLMVDSSVNQMDFESLRGIERITELIKDEQADDRIRLKCGEFLLLLMGHVYGRERPPLATVHDDMRRLLGEKCASLVWAASQFGSTLDPEQRQTALQIQARRVLESLDMY